MDMLLLFTNISPFYTNRTDYLDSAFANKVDKGLVVCSGDDYNLENIQANKKI